MSYTTDGHPQGRPNKMSNCIREAMIAEIVAINQYNYHINKEHKLHYPEKTII